MHTTWQRETENLWNQRARDTVQCSAGCRCCCTQHHRVHQWQPWMERLLAGRCSAHMQLTFPSLVLPNELNTLDIAVRGAECLRAQVSVCNMEMAECNNNIINFQMDAKSITRHGQRPPRPNITYSNGTNGLLGLKHWLDILPMPFYPSIWRAHWRR